MKPCPTCGRRGQVPIVFYGVMCYSGPNGENWPMEMCRTCCGQGWVPSNADVDLHIEAEMKACEGFVKPLPYMTYGIPWK